MKINHGKHTKEIITDMTNKNMSLHNESLQKATSQDASSDTDLAAVPTLLETINKAYTELISKGHAYADVVDEITKTMSCDFHLDMEDVKSDNFSFSKNYVTTGSAIESVDHLSDTDDNRQAVNVTTESADVVTEQCTPTHVKIHDNIAEVDGANTSSKLDDVTDPSTSLVIDDVTPASRKSGSNIKKFFRRLFPCIFRTPTQE